MAFFFVNFKILGLCLFCSAILCIIYLVTTTFLQGDIILMKNYLLTITYDGANYFGWQKQKDKKTIQGEMILVLESVLQHPVSLVGSSRTDAGVSAVCQLANFKTNKVTDAQMFVSRLNHLLPKDIRVLAMVEVSKTFNSRHHTTGKTYEYSFYLSDISIPHYDKFSARFPANANMLVFEDSLQKLIGVHDFTSFCKTKAGTDEKVRTIDSISVVKTGDIYRVYITGKSFLYNMVRVIVGTAMDIASGKLELTMEEVLQKKDRVLAGLTAPAIGLLLFKTNY